MPLHHLDFPISFNAKTKMTTVQNKNGDYLKITANSHTASKNGQIVQIDVPAQNRDGRMFVPLR